MRAPILCALERQSEKLPSPVTRPTTRGGVPRRRRASSTPPPRALPLAGGPPRTRSAFLIGALGASLLFTTGVDARQPRRHKRPLPQQQLMQLNGDNLGNMRNGWGKRGGRGQQAQVAGAAVHDPWDGRLTARSISTAIDDATLFLRSHQRTKTLPIYFQQIGRAHV